MSFVENIKDSVEIAKQISNVEHYREIHELKKRNQELTRKVEELEEAHLLKSRMRHKDGLFFYLDGSADRLCPACAQK